MCRAEKLNAPVCRPERSASLNQIAWRSNDMNSLIQTRPSVQFRCRVEAGQLRYEQIVRVAGEDDNYQPAEPMVVQNAWNDFYRNQEAKECEYLTAGSLIVGAFLFALSAGNQNQTALFTFALITNMASASVLCTSSSATLGK